MTMLTFISTTVVHIHTVSFMDIAIPEKKIYTFLMSTIGIYYFQSQDLATFLLSPDWFLFGFSRPILDMPFQGINPGSLCAGVFRFDHYTSHGAPRK